MALLDRIRAITRHDPTRYRPFVVDDEPMGAVREDHLVHLARHPRVFTVGPRVVTLAGGHATPGERTAAVDTVVEDLHARRLIAPPYGEQFPVARSFGEKPRFLLDRSAVTFFGVRAWGVHLNGYVGEGDAMGIWVARRSSQVLVEPGKLDHLTAGGQPHGISLLENLRKEAEEEAGIPAEVVEHAIPTGVVTYRFDADDGLRDDVLFTFDLELPLDFRPKSHDQELEDFAIWPVDRVLAMVRDTRSFKFNVGPVVIDFLVRHGRIGPEEPDYEAIVRGLRS